MSLPDPHETQHPSGFWVPDPDQGTPYLHLQFAMPSTAIMVWEPFPEDGPAGGHNLFGFAKRWAEWKASREPFLQAVDPRFGFPQLIPREAIPQLVQIAIQYHRKEDVRAGVRGLAVPGQPQIRQLANGTFEIAIPR